MKQLSIIVAFVFALSSFAAVAAPASAVVASGPAKAKIVSVKKVKKAKKTAVPVSAVAASKK